MKDHYFVREKGKEWVDMGEIRWGMSYADAAELYSEENFFHTEENFFHTLEVTKNTKDGMILKYEIIPHITFRAKLVQG
jgi:hypothetical protein